MKKFKEIIVIIEGRRVFRSERHNTNIFLCIFSEMLSLKMNRKALKGT